MRTWLNRVRRMTSSDYVTAVEVLTLAVWVEAALGVMPFSRLLQRVIYVCAEVCRRREFLAIAKDWKESGGYSAVR